LVLINKSISGQSLDSVFCLIRKYNTNAPIVEALYKPAYLVSALNDKECLPISTLKGKSVLAFSGIADPSSFLDQLKGIGAIMLNSVIFSDHHWFSERDLDRIKKIANSSSAEYIVTTEKDGVRLPANCKDGIYILTMKMGFKKSQVDLENLMRPILVQ
jgi:tetraacyldisaccharide 4'-kinase